MDAAELAEPTTKPGEGAPLAAAIQGVARAGGHGRIDEVRYRRILIGTLGLTELVSFGVLQFAFSALLVPMEADTGWSRAVLTGGYSVGLVMAGAAAIPIGVWIDRRGPRAVMTAGSALAALLVFAWSAAASVPVYLAIWSGLGVCMAAVLYEPAFAVIGRWFREDRGRALGWLTMIAALSSTVFVPLTANLVEAYGWRGALRVLAVVLLVATVLPHALVLRPNPSEVGPHPQRRKDGLLGTLRSDAFRRCGVAFGFSGFTAIALYVHLVPLAVERGLSLQAAAMALGLAGLMKLPGRAAFTALAAGRSADRLAVGLLAVQAAGLGILLVVPGAAGIWLCAIAFGAGDGGLTPARAAVLGERFAPQSFGAMLGAMGLVLSVSRAAAPIGLSVLAGGIGYAGAMGVLFAGLVAAAAVLSRPSA